MNGALSGIRILDLTQMMAGPFCTMMLGDMGADVIKVEPPDGDPIRRTGDTRIGGETEYQLSLNRNKRSIVLDLKTPDGVAAARKLAQACDVVVENFRPGTAERLGLGYETLRAQHPDLVYCAMSGFGVGSANQDRPALDPVIQAMSGIMQLTGTQESGPLRTGFALSDYITPMFAVQAILAALFVRATTGKGQRIDLSMLDATVFSIVPREGYYFATGKMPARIGNEHYQLVPYNTFRTADGRALFVLAHTDKFWKAVTDGIGDAELAADPRLASNAGRQQHRALVNQRLAEAIASRTAAEWEERLTRAGALFSVVRDFDQVFSDPDVERTLMRWVDHPTAGRIRMLAYPVQFAATPASIRRPAPLLGEHADEIRREFGL